MPVGFANRLVLAQTDLTVAAVEHVLETGWQLEELVVSGPCDLDLEALELLLKSSPRLRGLTLHLVDIERDILGDVPCSLAALHLEGCHLDDGVLGGALLRHADSLEVLGCPHTRLGPKDQARLAQASMDRLSLVDLKGAGLEPAVVENLARASWGKRSAQRNEAFHGRPVPSLEVSLAENDIGDVELGHLLSGTWISHVRRLDLSGCPIGTAGLTTLATSASLCGLEGLCLLDIPLEPDGLRALAESSALRSLADLVFEWEGLDGEHIEDILRASLRSKTLRLHLETRLLAWQSGEDYTF